jgi:hypothetical protein
MRNQIDLLNMVQPYVGTYFSQKYVLKNVLRLSDTDIETMKDEISKEPPPPQIGVPGVPPEQPPINNAGQ